jgi:hypothetical protein
LGVGTVGILRGRLGVGQADDMKCKLPLHVTSVTFFVKIMHRNEYF